MATKTFSSGDVLTAADTNTYLANSGTQFVAAATFTDVGSFDVTGFSGDFDVYRLVVAVKRHTSGTSTLTCQIRLGGSSYGSQYYGAYSWANYQGSSGVVNRNNGTNIPLPDCANAPPALIDATIRGPGDQAFSMTYNGYNTAGSSMLVGGFSNYASPNNFDEIRIFGSANITGSWQLSGARV